MNPIAHWFLLALLSLITVLAHRDRVKLRALVRSAKRVAPLPGERDPIGDMTVDHETAVGPVGITVGKILLTRRTDEGIPKARCPTVIALHGLPVFESASEARGLARVLDELAEHLT
jgi:hypothetical protein